MSAAPTSHLDWIEEFISHCAELRAHAQLMREANSLLMQTTRPPTPVAFENCRKRFRVAWREYRRAKDSAGKEAAREAVHRILTELANLIECHEGTQRPRTKLELRSTLSDES
jgi:hypothetical protein